MRVLRAEQMRALDKAAEEEIGIPGIVLMENAGRAVADKAEQMLGGCRNKRIVIFAGKGNNGGDGSGAGRWLANRGARVTLVLAAEAARLAGSAADELQYFISCGAPVLQITDCEDAAKTARIRELISHADLVIDALLGTGFSGALQPLTRLLCRCINEGGRRSGGRCRVLAVDIPSGVNADDGSADSDAVIAQVTVTMALPKQGLYLYPGKGHTGELTVADIGMPALLLDSGEKDCFLLTDEMVRHILPKRPATAHKGTAGRLILTAGSRGYTGAAALSAFAAVKAGAGLVTLFTPESVRETLAIKLTEVMVKGLPVLQRASEEEGLAPEAAEAVLAALENADVLAIGPGSGTRSAEVIRRILGTITLPCVIDADALRALQDHTELLPRMPAEKVLTPHPGEMAGLTGLSAAETDRNRVDVAREYAEKWQAVVVLKGAPTVIAWPDGTVYLNPTGTPAMASGGSGDVLTGIIGALIAQGMKAKKAALAGVYLHGLAGEIAAQNSIGLAASEISQALPQARLLLGKA